MSQQSQYAQFFCQLSLLGSCLGHGSLRDGARTLLLLMPPDKSTVEKLQILFSGNTADLSDVTLDTVFFSASSAQVLYNIEVNYLIFISKH